MSFRLKTTQLTVMEFSNITVIILEVGNRNKEGTERADCVTSGTPLYTLNILIFMPAYTQEEGIRFLRRSDIQSHQITAYYLVCFKTISNLKQNDPC